MTKFSKGDMIVFNQSVFLGGVIDTTGLIGEVVSEGLFIAIGDEWGVYEGEELLYSDHWVDIEKSNKLNNKQ